MQLNEAIAEAEELLVLADFEQAASTARSLLQSTTYAVGSSELRQRAAAVLMQAHYELGR